MWKWLAGGALVIGMGYIAYDYYRAGFHTRPELPEGAFSISFKSGLRAILVDVPNERASRRYFGYPVEVPFYLEDVWSYCYQPPDSEREQLRQQLGDRPGERIEGVCEIDVDGDMVVRGVVTSVPKL
ncbi:hypothetical protein [Ruegeria lacuscaerulensis]|uniref:hypothetical protein n=1 Tax=Ruegeria lacuscaerulensis TaxID=55218 RepID=UPI0014810A3C|nr:hypothetical protein [Ruegeria lacuscaerulensis]